MPQSRKKKNKKKHKNNATKGKTKTKDNLDNFQPVVSSWFSAGLSSFDHVLACLLQEGNTLENKISFHKECTDFSNETRGKNAEMNSYFIRACLNENFKKYDDVIVYSKKCIGIAERIGDQRVAMMSFLMLGRAYRELNQSDDAIVYSKKCIDIAKEIDEKGIEMTACFIVGKLYFSQSKYKEAVLYSERSLQNAKATGDKRYEAMVYLLLQDCQQHLEQYDDSILTGRKCIAVANEIGDTLGEINAYTIMGNTYQSLNRNDDAIGCIIKGLNIAKESGDRVLEMDSLFSLGKMYHSQDQYNNAVLNMNKTLNIAMETGSRSEEMYAYMALGDIYLALHQPENSLDCLQKCLHIAKETGNKHAEGDAYVLLGKTYDALHRENTAVLHLKKGIKIVKEIGIKDREMDAYFLLGKVYKSSKQYSDAIESFKKSIIIAWEIENKNMQKDVYFQIGNIYECMNQYNEAISYGKKYMEVAKEVGDEVDVMEAYLALGVSYLGLDQYDNTFFNLNKGLKLATELEDTNAIEQFNDFLGKFYLRVGVHGKTTNIRSNIQSGAAGLWMIDYRGKFQEEGIEINKEESFFEQYSSHRSNANYEQAIECLRKHVDAYELCPRYHSTDKVYCLIEIAKMHDILHQYDKSLQCYQEALSVAKNVEAKHLQAVCYLEQGLVYLRIGLVNQAEESFRKSINFFEIMFDDAGCHDEFKMSLLDTYSHCHKNLMALLIDTKQLEEALVASDQSRARSLKDLLINFEMKRETNEGQVLHYNDIKSLVLNKKYSILFYTVCCKTVSTGYTFIIDCGKKLQFSKMCLKHCGQGESFEKYIRRVFDEMKVCEDAAENCENRSLDDLREENGDNLYSDQSDLPPLMEIFQKANLPDKCRSVREEKEKSSNRTSENAFTESALEGLHQKLIHHHALYSVKEDGNLTFVENVTYHGKEDEIVIIPDGPLYKVPFAALRDPDTGQYLSETKRIRLAPSIATLKVLQERPAKYYSKKGTLIVGDPLVGKVMFNGQEKEFPPLENAFCEALAVGSIFYMTPLTKEKATKQAVIEKLQEGVSVVHIAAHGSLSKGTIALAPSPEIRATRIPDEEDYMLTMADVQKAQVRAQLVVLSCCHSGRGEIRAEGVVGMCRAFLASGARAVLASLWSIDDEATLEFMTRFYQNMIERKLSASTSLQQAMKELRNTANYNEPKYWAPFFLMGDDVTLKF